MRISDWSSDVCSSDLVNIRTIGDGWGTWSGGYTGQVLFSNGATSVSGTFTNPVGAFGFFSERSEEHTSELQSLMRISYAVFCLKKKKKQHNNVIIETKA